MRPVVCANCGTKNLRGSKYCNECGHELTPTSTQLCPNCEASNPIDRLYCDNCGARLAAEEEAPREEKEPPDEAADAGRPEPFSLPERPPGQTGRLELDRGLPAWLRTGKEEDEELADNPEPADESGSPEEAAPEEERGEHQPTDDLPDWLLEEDEASDIFRSEKTTDELFLASQEEGDGGDEENGEEEEATEAGLAAASPKKGKAEKALNDWLAGAEPDDEEEAAGADLADWLEELEQEGDAAPAEEGLSDWLAELEDHGEEDVDESEGEDEGEAGEGVGAWPGDLEEGQQPKQQPEEEDEGLADWLADLEGEEEAEAGEAATPAFSDWLADLEEEATVETGEPLDAEEEEPAAGDAEEDWLSWEMEAAGEEEPEAPGPEAEERDEAEAGVPDWLADLEGQEEEAEADSDREEATGKGMALEVEGATERDAVEAGAEEAASEEALPWETESGADDAEAAVESEEEEPAAPGPEVEQPEAEEWGEAEAGVPDWLADLGEEDGAAEEAAPEGAFSEEAAADWLSRLHGEEVQEEEQEEEEEEAAGATEEEAPETGVPEIGDAPPEGVDAEIPAWLADLDSEAIQTARTEEAAEDEAAPEAETEEAPDWLASFDAEEEGAWAMPETAGDETPAEEDLPDWLAEVDEATADAAAIDAAAIDAGAEEAAGAAEEDEQEEALPADEIPSWLQELAPEAKEGDGEEADEELTAILGAMDAGDDMPDWLTEEDATTPEEAEALTEAPMEASLEEEDDVFAGFEDSAPEGAPAAPEVEEEGLFDWSDVDAPPEEGEAPAEIDFTAAAEEALDFGEPFDLPVEMEDSDRVPAEDLPDWLGDVMADVDAEAPAGEEADIPASAEEAAADLENVPEQLAGSALPEWLEDSLPEEAAPAEPTPLEEMPDWIQAAGQSFLSEAEEEAPGAGVEDEEQMEEFDLGLETSGEWEDLLEGLPPPEPTAEEVREAEIPDWVQALKPQEMTGEEPETREPQTPAETSGPLAGLQGVIGVEPAVTEPRSTSPMAPLAPSKEQERQAALLRQLTRSEESEAIVVAPAAETAASPWVRALLTLLLLATVLVGLFVPGLLETTPQTTGVAQAQDAIAAASGQPVLVAFDYTPAMAADLDGQARLLLEALAEGDSPVLFISQSPAGLALAQQAVEQVDGLESRRLGYLPGEAIGLRRLAACLETGSACRPIAGLGGQEAVEISAADLGLIVVFAADRDSLINWIEQVDAATAIPMVAGVTQALAPVAGPYVTSGQLDGLLAGFPATAALQAESGEMSNRTQAELEMLTLAQWLVVVLFVLGNLLYLAFGARGSQKAAQVAAQTAEGEDA